MSVPPSPQPGTAAQIPQAPGVPVKKAAKPYSKLQVSGLLTIPAAFFVYYLLCFLPLYTVTDKNSGNVFSFNGYFRTASAQGTNLNIEELRHLVPSIFTPGTLVLGYSFAIVIPLIFIALALWLRKGWLRYVVAVVTLLPAFAAFRAPGIMQLHADSLNSAFSHASENSSWTGMYLNALHMDVAFGAYTLMFVGVMLLAAIVMILIPSKSSRS